MLDQSRYVQSLINDLDYELAFHKLEKPVSSVFMGGGTPSLFSPESMNHLLQQIAERVSMVDEVEITMEANPGTTEHADFSAYRQAGINRLSIGVQSFNDHHLTTLGRVHSASEAQWAYENARSGGFDNINLDLMFALPSQQVDEAVSDIDQAIGLQPDHISAYQLTLEPDTVFYRHPPPLPNEDSVYEIESALKLRLAAAGYGRYEISAYSQNNKRCQHNLNYWEFGDYLGIGAGAHSKISLEHGILRRSRKKHPESYMRLAGSTDSIAETRTISSREVLFEYLMNALRLIDGFDIENAACRTGLPAQTIVNRLQKPIDQGLILLTDDRIKCSKNGQLFLDSILTELLE